MSVPGARPWPPVIVAARMPVWMKVRDVVLTWLMWASFLGLLFGELEIRASNLFGVGIDWRDLLRQLEPFLAIVAILTASLFVASQFTRRRRRRGLLLPEPPPLTLAEHAERGRMSEETLLRGREKRIVVIHVDAERRVRFENRLTPP
jgi:poly-beta-1,6-N-acetyl-D-glucosamine biosynthesis protein PgaD